MPLQQKNILLHKKTQMLKAGIVGLKNSEKYIDTLNSLKEYSFTGIYDPSFEITHTNKNKKAQADFGILAKKCDLLIFANTDNTFYPLILKAIYNSKHILLNSTNNYTYEQLNNISKLANEASVNIQVLHNHLFSEIFENYFQTQTKPLIIESNVDIAETHDLLKTISEEISNCLFLAKSNIRQSKVHITTANSQIPDVYYVSLDFDNGCFCNILVNAISNTNNKQMRIIGHNTLHKLQFTKLTCKNTINGITTTNIFNKENNTAKKMTAKQLEKLYYKITNNNTTIYPLDIELNTHKIIKKISEKVRVCSNLF